MVQIINDSEHLQLIWDFKPTNENSKVKSFKWIDIKNIDLIYEERKGNKILTKIFGIFIVIGAFLINAEIGPVQSADMKEVKMVIFLNDENKFSFDLVVYDGIIDSIKERLKKNRKLNLNSHK